MNLSFLNTAFLAMLPDLDFPWYLLVSFICVVVVIAMLALIIGVCSLFFKGMSCVSNMHHINAKKENKILDEDEDAAVALICATIDFHKETGKEPRCVSIKKID